MILNMPNGVLNEKKLLKEIASYELRDATDAQALKYATQEGIQEQIYKSKFIPLLDWVNMGRGSEFITGEQSKDLYKRRVQQLDDKYDIKESDLSKYCVAPFYVMSQRPNPFKEGTIISTLEQMNMIKENNNVWN